MRTLTMVLSILLAGLFVGTPCFAADPAATRAKELYQRGTKHYQVGEYKEALEAFKAGYLAKSDPSFLFNVGQCYRQLGDLENEIQEYRAYLRDSPQAPNRASVEDFIAKAEAEQARRRLLAPPDAVTTKVAIPPERVEVKADVKPQPKRLGWIGYVVGAVVVVGVGVTIGIVATRPGEASLIPGIETANFTF